MRWRVKYEAERAIRPRMADFEEFVAQHELHGVAVDDFAVERQ